MRFGVPHSGPMDRSVFSVLCGALEEKNHFTAIEVPAIGGFSIKCTEGAVTIGFFGGGFTDVYLDGHKLPPWSVLTLEPGSTLTVKPGASGSWGYLGFCGTLQAEKWLGSQANLLSSGLCGRPFATGDELVVTGAEVNEAIRGALPLPSMMRFSGVVRAVLGPQDRFFSKNTITAFRSSTYRVSTEYDRMGMRLQGEKLDIEGDLNMPSEALLRGAVQVPGHGDPVVLLADHQTTGGYPKIATIISSDLDRMSQLRPNDLVGFQLLSAEEGGLASRRIHADLASYIQRIPELRYKPASHVVREISSG